MPRQLIIKILLIAGLLACLLQVWLPHYYLTGDGPCLVYNARMLSDFWRGHDTSLYSRFYQLAYQPNPNWVSHIFIASLMYFADGPVAEKIFLSFYVVLLLSGFYRLLNKISEEVPAWLLVILLFVFHHTLAKGFYNFSLSIGFYFWMVWGWLRFMDKKNPINAVLFFVCSGLLFFTHLLPFVIGVATCALLCGSYALAHGYKEVQSKKVFFLKTILSLGLMLGPFLWLSFWFTQKEGGLRLHLALHPYRFIEHMKFKYLVNFSSGEMFYAAIAGITLTALMLTGFWHRFKKGFSWNKFDGFLASWVFVSLVYMIFPESFMGRGILITMRTQIFVYILMACCISYMVPRDLRNAGGFVLLFCFGGLTFVRIVGLLKASDAAVDYVSAASFIRPGSVVFPLDFAPGGKDANGKPLSNENYLFTHTADYIGALKPMILLDNYEANVGYFPFCWKANKSPYAFLSTYEGIESHPPSADIDAYHKASGEQIDYVLMWCYDPGDLTRGHYKQLADQVNRDYHLIYKSPAGLTLLYERNK